jgi:hypothetical protein
MTENFSIQYPATDNCTVAPDTLIDKYSAKLPAYLIDLWKSSGLGKYRDGLIELINPEDYEEVLHTWLGKATPNYVPFAISAFGELFYYRKFTETDEIEFVPRPPRKHRNSNTNSVTSQRRYSKKSDKIGRIGEEWVFEYEKRKLIKSGRKDLSERVIWHRHNAENRTPGWDITSFSEDGIQKYIEVKSSTGQAINEIILTSKEWQKACDSELSKNYFIYLVSDVSKKPSLEIIKNPSSFVEMKKIGI